MAHLLFPPALILIIGGFMMFFASRRWREALSILLPILTLVQIWQLDGRDIGTMPLMGYELLTVYVHDFSRIFATAFAIATLGGGIFALTARRKVELSAAYIYAGSAIGVTFAGDLITLFIFWEIMALASTIVIWSAGTAKAKRAGLRYAMVHLFGGVLLMAGITAQVGATGVIVLPEFHLNTDLWLWTSTAYSTNLEASSFGTWLILLGILVNVAAPPFSSWLPNAYPEASPTGMVFLSAFTTKAAVFVLLTLFAGVDLLIPIGVFMIFYGIVMAILENDMRRILAYSIINQVGFMVVGVGIGTPLSMMGTAAHAFCHIIYKALLLMSAGSVLHMTGKRLCTDLGGLYRTMPITAACGIIGALAISSFPGTSGFVSKSLISGAAAHEELVWVWYALLAASAGVFLHAGIKFPWFVFYQKDSGMRPADPPKSMRFAMLSFAALCIIPGIFPEQTLYFMLPETVGYVVNKPSYILSQTQLLLFAGLAFFVCLPLLARTLTITLDFDWLYRVPARKCLIFLERMLIAVYTRIIGAVQHSANLSLGSVFRLTGPRGVLAETKTLANTTLIVALLLAGYLLLYLNT